MIHNRLARQPEGPPTFVFVGGHLVENLQRRLKLILAQINERPFLLGANHLIFFIGKILLNGDPARLGSLHFGVEYLAIDGFPFGHGQRGRVGACQQRWLAERHGDGGPGQKRGGDTPGDQQQPGARRLLRGGRLHQHIELLRGGRALTDQGLHLVGCPLVEVVSPLAIINAAAGNLQRAQIQDQLPGRLITIVRIFFEHLVDDATQPVGQIRPQALQALGRFVEMLDRDAEGRFALKRCLAGEQLKKSYAQRVDVAAGIEQFALDLFGAHVQRRAHRHTDLREVRRRFVSGDPRQAEIGHLHQPVSGQHDVLGLDVAVNDAVLCRFVQCRGGLTHDRHRQLHVGRAVAGEHLGEILPLHIFLRNVMHPFNAADLEDLYDVRMGQRSGRPSLMMKPLNIGFVARQISLENFQRHLAAKRFLFGQINLCHRPASQTAKDPKIAQLLARIIDLALRLRRRGR